MSVQPTTRPYLPKKPPPPTSQRCSSLSTMFILTSRLTVKYPPWVDCNYSITHRQLSALYKYTNTPVLWQYYRLLSLPLEVWTLPSPTNGPNFSQIGCRLTPHQNIIKHPFITLDIFNMWGWCLCGSLNTSLHAYTTHSHTDKHFIILLISPHLLYPPPLPEHT